MADRGTYSELIRVVGSRVLPRTGPPWPDAAPAPSPPPPPPPDGDARFIELMTSASYDLVVRAAMSLRDMRATALSRPNGPGPPPPIGPLILGSIMRGSIGPPPPLIPKLSRP